MKSPFARDVASHVIVLDQGRLIEFGEAGGGVCSAKIGTDAARLSKRGAAIAAEFV